MSANGVDIECCIDMCCVVQSMSMCNLARANEPPIKTLIPRIQLLDRTESTVPWTQEREAARGLRTREGATCQPFGMEPDESVVETDRAPAEEDCSVCVAVHIRPLIENEIADGCQPCLSVANSQPQVRSKLLP